MQSVGGVHNQTNSWITRHHPKHYPSRHAQGPLILVYGQIINIQYPMLNPKNPATAINHPSEWFFLDGLLIFGKERELHG